MRKAKFASVFVAILVIVFAVFATVPTATAQEATSRMDTLPSWDYVGENPAFVYNIPKNSSIIDLHRILNDEMIRNPEASGIKALASDGEVVAVLEIKQCSGAQEQFYIQNPDLSAGMLLPCWWYNWNPDLGDAQCELTCSFIGTNWQCGYDNNPDPWHCSDYSCTAFCFNPVTNKYRFKSWSCTPAQ